MRKIKKWIVAMLIFGLVLPVVGYGEKTEAMERSTETIETSDYIFENVTFRRNRNKNSNDGEDEEVVEEEEFNTGSTEEETFMEPFNTSPTIEEIVLWDEQGVKVTATSLDYTSWTAELHLTLENNSDKTLSFIGGSLSYCWYAINGYTIDDGFINTEVEPGEIVEDTISFSTSGLMVYGINEIAEIQMGLMVEDDDYNSFILKPQKIETSISESYDYDVDTYQEVLKNGVFEQLGDCNIDYLAFDELYSSNNISMISEMIMTQEDDEDGTEYALVLEMSNESDYYIYAILSNIYVNDILVYDYSWTSETMMPNTKAMLMIDVNSVASKWDDYEDSFFDNGVESIGFTLSIKNENYEDALEPQEITINF